MRRVCVVCIAKGGRVFFGDVCENTGGQQKKYEKRLPVMFEKKKNPLLIYI